MKTKVAFFFDDNFRKSFTKVADLYESLGLRAIFCNVAEPPLSWRKTEDLGNWDLWNELLARGHAIHPHGFDHTNLAQIALEAAQDDIEKCLEVYSRHLGGFDPAQTIFHFPFNSSTEELTAWTLKQVAAVRIGGPGLNHAPDLQKRILYADAHGPDNCAAHLQSKLLEAGEARPPLFCYNLHGLDGEGWGTIDSDQLSRILRDIQGTAHLEMARPEELLELLR